MTARLPVAALLVALFTLLTGPALARCSKNLAELSPNLLAPTLLSRGVRVASLDGMRMAADSGSRAIITFLGHASFEINTPQGVRAITDYNGLNGFGRKPDIVTMNNAHSTHYTDHPEEGITYILPGWPTKPGETEAKHEVTLKDLKVSNVPTNARDWGGGSARINGNSIFTFTIGPLCIAHLGHLHHPLEPGHLRALGRVDIVLFPVDGSYTLDQTGMLDVLKSIQARVMIPMHFFGGGTLNRFLARAEGQGFTVERRSDPSLVLSRASLPGTPRVIALPGR